MIKVELHSHPIGGSPCADGNTKLAVQKFIDAGYGGVVCTSHYSKPYYENFLGQTHKEKIDFFFKVYDDFAVVANEKGLKTFFGAEIRCLPTNTEYIVVGFDRAFLYDNQPLFNLSQQELFELADKNGFFMYQTHPFRTGVIAGNPKFMHGAESFNGHYHHINNNDCAKEFCEKNNLVGVVGTDYHHDDQPLTTGINLPKSIDTEKQLAEFLRKGDFKFVADKELYEKSLEKHLQRKK